MFGVMPTELPTALPTMAVVLQVVGLGSMFLMRCHERGESLSQWHQRIFLVLLVSVGAATAYCLGCGHSGWLSCGTTFSIMAVGATIDLRPGPSWGDH